MEIQHTAVTDSHWRNVQTLTSDLTTQLYRPNCYSQLQKYELRVYTYSKVRQLLQFSDVRASWTAITADIGATLLLNFFGPF